MIVNASGQLPPPKGDDLSAFDAFLARATRNMPPARADVAPGSSFCKNAEPAPPTPPRGPPPPRNRPRDPRTRPRTRGDSRVCPGPRPRRTRHCEFVLQKNSTHPPKRPLPLRLSSQIQTLLRSERPARSRKSRLSALPAGRTTSKPTSTTTAISRPAV
jgi:hypothetical protein